jgi:hypothetical protein
VPHSRKDDALSEVIHFATIVLEDEALTRFEIAGIFCAEPSEAPLKDVEWAAWQNRKERIAANINFLSVYIRKA